VAECFQLADVATLGAFGVDAGVPAPLSGRAGRLSREVDRDVLSP